LIDPSKDKTYELIKGLFEDMNNTFIDNMIHLGGDEALTSCYKRSPFFEYYEEGVSQILNKRQPYLIDLNMSISYWLEKVLKTNFNISKSTAEIPYLDPYFIEARDSSTNPKAALHIANQVYPQVFSDKIEFLPNCSILDLLFCMGPSANIYLKDSTLQ
jgi:hypothetical protein